MRLNIDIPIKINLRVETGDFQKKYSFFRAHFLFQFSGEQPFQKKNIPFGGSIFFEET